MIDKLMTDDTAAGEQRLIPLMREAVMDRVERTSLRGAAREIGMSPSGLKKFLDGNMPYTKTIHRLRRWYLQHAGDAREELCADDGYTALAVLVNDLPPGIRAQTVEAMAGSLAEGYARASREIPHWIAGIRDRSAR